MLSPFILFGVSHIHDKGIKFSPIFKVYMLYKYIFLLH